MSIPGEVIEARAGWADGVRDRLPAGAHVVVVGAGSAHCLEGRHAGLEFRDTIVIAIGGGFLAAAVFRVPLDGTVADQVLKTGTGGLWIDGCRIELSGTENLDAVQSSFDAMGFDGAYTSRAQIPTYNRSGRWPTNLVFVHESGCRCEGTKTSKRNIKLDAHRGVPSVCVYGDGLGSSTTSQDETVASWVCGPGCPVAALDAMSGIRSSHDSADRGGLRNDARPTSANFKRGVKDSLPPGRGDSGGASRFYPQLVGRDSVGDWLTRLVCGPPV